ncbi:MAG: ABC transporter permease [Gammaproteobacteria bacterium]|nr:ABC transporter permease [Gammaproteobacteria bacterium]
MLKLGLLSLLNRRTTFTLTVLSIAISVALILGIERLRSEARDGFTDTVSGIDLIVAARGNAVQILMATVFGIGSTTNAIGMDTYERIAALPQVEWAVPIAHGDNHRGFPVIGTTREYFGRYRYAGGRPLSFADGSSFTGPTGAVLGAEVALRHGYAVGARIVNAHGAGETAFDVHDEAPFTVTGVLERTGTPVDRMVFVSLPGFAAIHEDAVRAETRGADPLAIGKGRSRTTDSRVRGTRDRSAEARGAGARRASRDDREERHDATRGLEETEAHVEDHGADELEHLPGRINAMLIGLKSKSAVLSMQRFIAEYPDEPLSAVLPAATLLELWTLTAIAENSLRLVAMAVVVAGMLGMVTMVSATLDARRREFAILRSVGATPWHVCGLIVLEAAVITATGLIAGTLLFYLGIALASPLLADRFGLNVGLDTLSQYELGILLLVGAFGLLASLFPAWRVYRRTLADGLAMRV